MTASTSSPRGPLPPRASPTGSSPEASRSERAARGALGPGPGFRPPPRGWRHSRAVGREKAGQGSANPKRGGAAPIPAPLPGLQACLSQLFKLFQSTRTPATFGKQLNPAGGERRLHSPEGQSESGDRGATGPSSRHSARPQPPPGTPARDSFQPQDGQLLASAPARVGDFRKPCPRGRLGKEGPGLLPRLRGAGGGAGREPGRRLRPSPGEARS